MICPYCNMGVTPNWEDTDAIRVDDVENPRSGELLSHGLCPECKEIIVKLVSGLLTKHRNSYKYTIYNDRDEKIIYPTATTRFVPKEVPVKYSKDFKEASQVLSISVKTCAAISRRLLQMILRGALGASKIDVYFL